MLIAFVALMALLNGFLGLVGTRVEQLLGYGLSPLAWTMGMPWTEAKVVGELLGQKLILTDLVAFVALKNIVRSQAGLLSQRTVIVASYALCGFANVASVGVQLGGLGVMAPTRKADFARLGLLAMVAGALVSCLSGTVAGILSW